MKIKNWNTQKDIHRAFKAIISKINIQLTLKSLQYRSICATTATTASTDSSRTRRRGSARITALCRARRLFCDFTHFVDIIRKDISESRPRFLWNGYWRTKIALNLRLYSN